MATERYLVVVMGFKPATRLRHSGLGPGQVAEVVPTVVGSDVAVADAL